MRKRIPAVMLLLFIAASAPARGELIFEADRVIDMRTSLVWLNVWQGEPLVNRDRLIDVAGGWRHATRAEIQDVFFRQFGIPVSYVDPHLSLPPFNPAVRQLILHLGGTAGRIVGSPPGGEANDYAVGGWYRSDWYSERGPTFDDIVVRYREIPELGGWLGSDVGSIGSYTSVPPQFRSPLAYFLVRPAVPEPPIALLFATGMMGLGAMRGSAQLSNIARSFAR